MINKYNIKKNCCVIPKFVHIEVTEKCNVGCPQCYCDLHKGRDMKWELFKDIVYEIHDFGIDKVMLTGGEPISYSHLLEAVKLIKQLNMKAIISSSGYGLTSEYIKQLVEGGLEEFYISLNGSKAEIHELSRGHFDEGIAAVNMIKSLRGWCGINWVARKDNIADLKNMIELAKNLSVDCFHIISPKEDSKGNVEELELSDIIYIADIIKKERIDGLIGIDLCFQELNYHIEGEELNEIYRKCLAGRMFFDISVDGSFSPCRHLISSKEKKYQMKEYWNHSDILEKIRCGVGPCGLCRKSLMYLF